MAAGKKTRPVRLGMLEPPSELWILENFLPLVVEMRIAKNNRARHVTCSVIWNFTKDFSDE